MEVYGLTPQQADSLSKTINWNLTLVFPFPLGTTQIQQVDVNGAQGVLLDTAGAGLLPGMRHSQQAAPGSGQGSGQGGQSAPSVSPSSANWTWVLYWQHGAQFYILEGAGSALGTSPFTQAAASVK